MICLRTNDFQVKSKEPFGTYIIIWQIYFKMMHLSMGIPRGALWDILELQRYVDKPLIGRERVSVPICVLFDLSLRVLLSNQILQTRKSDNDAKEQRCRGYWLGKNLQRKNIYSTFSTINNQSVRPNMNRVRQLKLRISSSHFFVSRGAAGTIIRHLPPQESLE